MKLEEEIILLSQLAAFVDGEGTISIDKSLNTRGHYGYNQRLSVANTDIRLIEWLLSNFGGKMPKARKKEGLKDNYVWRLFSTKSYKLLKNIRPYLLLKYEQADLAIELYEKISSRFDSNKSLVGYKKRRAEEIYQKVRELNIVGNKEGNDKDFTQPVIKSRKITETLEEYVT